MAMTNAERQKRYREKRREEGGSRLNMAIDAGSHACLKRIARFQGLTEREALQEILLEAEAQLVEKHEKLRKTRTKAYKEYYDNVWE